MPFDSNFHLDMCQYKLDKAELSVPELYLIVHVDGVIVDYHSGVEWEVVLHRSFPQVFPKLKDFSSAVGIDQIMLLHALSQQYT